MNEKVLRLMQLAMEISQAGKAHAFVDYAGHVDTVFCKILPGDQAYIEGAEFMYLFPKRSISLKRGKPEVELDEAIAEFESLLMGDAA